MPKPNDPDSISGPDTICLDLPIEYSVHNAQQGSIFSWEITGGSFSGGSSIATGNKITAVFTGAPPHELKARRISTSPAGCESDEITKSLNIRQIDVNITGPNAVCDNSYQTYTSSFKAGESYEWFIIPETRGSVVAGDGTDEVMILWNTTNPGQLVDVVVAVRACGGIHYDTMAVFVTPGPTVSLNADNSTICAGAQVVFTAQGTPALTSGNITWIFGNGDTVFNGSFTQTYTYPAGLLNATSYTVTAIIENANGCGNTVAANYQINVEPAPIAFISPAMNYEFCDDSLSISVPLTATVQSGVGSTISFSWFRNGTPVATGPNYTATTFGTYYCEVVGNNGCSGITNLISITKACDTTNNGSGTTCTKLYNDSSSIAYTLTNCNTVELTGSVNSGSIISSSLNAVSFSPSQTASGTNATFEIEQAGIFIFEFYSIVDLGGANCTYKDSIHIQIPLVADLMHSISCGANGQYNVSLLDHSTYLTGNAITNYQFVVNGTNVQNGPSDSYSGTFPAGTTLDVILNVTAPSGTCSTNLQIELPPFPFVDFEMEDTICEGAPLAFTNLSSSGTGVTYNWEFTGGAETTVENPSRVFGSAGSKDISLTVRNALGCESQLTKSVMVLGNNFSFALFSDPTITCEGNSSVLEHTPSIFDIPEIIY
ncbi:MAG: PKD domain-containing protein [Flavobacteriales bacterium]|nr:MAG: PKD domain-containing protein [Flavobacteriales bacterium]